MGVADHSKNTFLELKRKKVHRYVIFKIDEKKKEVVVEKTGGPAESFDEFAASLPENDCRYAVYDFDFVTSENCQKSKIFFIAWLAFNSNALILFLISVNGWVVHRVWIRTCYPTTKIIILSSCSLH